MDDAALVWTAFGLEHRQREWLRRTFGHKRMNAGLRAIIDEAMDESPIGTKDEEDADSRHTVDRPRASAIAGRV